MKKWMGMAVTALATLTLTTSVIKADDESNANTEAAQESVDYSGEVRISGKTNRERLGQFNYLLRHNLGYDIYLKWLVLKAKSKKSIYAMKETKIILKFIIASPKKCKTLTLIS